MNIRFILDYRVNKAGDEKEVAKAVGDKLIYRGIAIKVKGKK